MARPASPTSTEGFGFTYANKVGAAALLPYDWPAQWGQTSGAPRTLPSNPSTRQSRLLR